jgi:hypothetical protein
MRGVTRMAVFGFLIFAIVFDLLILGSILHGNGNASAISQSPDQNQPDFQAVELEYADKLMPSALPEQPLIRPN